jgi:phenylacetate-coenzyme A ligase PaaK-like adenylate-forming protein
MLENEIFNIKTPEDFEQLALKIFRHQYEHTKVYRQFCDFLKVSPKTVQTSNQIPFLPIQFFKSHKVISETVSPAIRFRSSGTTGGDISKHYVADLDLYERSFTEAFQKNYGKPSEYAILALLPSYLEREGSSLIYMVDKLIEQSSNPHSGFYLNDLNGLIEKLHFLEGKHQKTILLGVSYALLDVIAKQKFSLKNTLIMETGGMKGKRKELVKAELHQILKLGFGVDQIHSEYGMTELLSQAYSKGENIFTCPPWMKIRTRDPEDALTQTQDLTGGINVIDLANLYSCSFIATQDLGKSYEDGSFEIMGRFDTSDIRGCNLMIN